MGISGRGGKRAGGGRPSEWQNQPTCTIRVPEVFADILLQIAKELDKGTEEVVVIDPKSLNIDVQVKKEYLSPSQIRIYKHSGHKVLRVKEVIRALQHYLEQDD